MGQAARIQFHDNVGLSIRVQIQQGSRIHLYIQKARLIEKTSFFDRRNCVWVRPFCFFIPLKNNDLF